jgi:manganese transport protein
MRADDKILGRPGHDRSPRGLALLGPAFVTAVAYVDPGNVATNVTAGARFGFTLVWVVVLANLMAVLVQYLSAKLGLVTGTSLAGHVAQRLPRPARIAYWLQAEGVAVATDLAEVIGGAVALHLLFDLPLALGAVLTAVVALAVLRIGDQRGQAALERVVLSFLALIAVGFLAGLVVEPPGGAEVTAGLVPSFAGAESVLLASGIVGATVMPHAIYLHSSLTTERHAVARAQRPMAVLLRATRLDVVLALLLAGVLNLSLLLVAATSLADRPSTDTLEGAHAVVTAELGTGVALLFAVALLGSGLASTSVGSAAGAEIMRSLTGLRVAPTVRRLVTLVPAVTVLAFGVDPTRALVISQVVLSMGIPFALVPLVGFTASRPVMGPHRNHPLTTAAAAAVAVVIVTLNLALLGLTLSG